RDGVLGSAYILSYDGILDRYDMLSLFKFVGMDGVVSWQEFQNLNSLVAYYGLPMPDHVRVLARKVVQGDPANAWWTGGWYRMPLGNLYAGSGAAQLDQLVDKWFRGLDRPALLDRHAGVGYRAVNGNLFDISGQPSYLQVAQGQLGDCTLMA